MKPRRAFGASRPSKANEHAQAVMFLINCTDDAFERVTVGWLMRRYRLTEATAQAEYLKAKKHRERRVG